jgi:hypothetical protein
MTRNRFSAREDFIDRVLSLPKTEHCIFWPFAIRKSTGYGAHGTFVDGKKKNYDAHNYVCRRAHGEPPEGFEASHECGKKLCVNPWHLYWNDHYGNMQDAIEHGVLRGGGVNRRKLFPKDISFIVSSQQSHIAIGEHYGIEPAYVGRVRRSAGWRKLTYDL